MKKTTLLILCFLMAFYGFSQTAQNFATSGPDSAPTVLTINAGDITVNGSDPITNVTIGTFTSNYNTPTGNSGQCGNWYDFILNVTGGAADGTNVQGCDADFNGIDVTGFTTITLTSNDLDGTDTVFFDIDLLVTFTPSSAPDCDATLTQTNNVLTNGDISWTAATGSVDNYSVSVGTSSGASDVYNENLGNVLTTNIGTLSEGTTYYVNIVPSNSVGTATGCTEQTFITFEPAANDECTGAIALVCGNTLPLETTIGATGGSGTSCIGTIGDDVWYSYSGNDKVVALTVIGDGQAPQVEVYESSDGTCSGFSAGTCYANAGSSENPVTLQFSANLGSEYFIRIGHYINGNPSFNFSIETQCEDFPEAPNCAEAPISPMNGATAVDASTNEVTFSWTAPSTGDPVDGYEVLLGTESGNLTSLGVTPNVSVPITGIEGGVTYYWQIVPQNSGGSATGCPEWSFTTAPIAPPTTIGTITINSCGESDSLTNTYVIGEVTWVELVVVEDGCDFSFNTLTSTIGDSEIGIYSEGGVLLGSNDDAASGGSLSELIASGFSAGTYYIAVSSFNTDFGPGFNVTTSDTDDTGDITVSVASTIPNDDCDGAVVIDSADFGTTLSGTNVGATDSGVADACVTNGNDVWYQFVAAEDGEVNVTIDAGFDYAFYSDCSGTLVGSCNSSLTTATMGSTYYLRIGDNGSVTRRAAGAFNFSISGSALSTADFDNETGFKYYPNPVNNILTLDAQQSIDNIGVYNMLGQEVLRLSPNTVNTEVDMSNLNTGAYFVKVSIQGATKTVRVIKQ